MDSGDAVKPKRKASSRAVVPALPALVEIPVAPEVPAVPQTQGAPADAGAPAKRTRRSSRAQQELDLIAACKKKSAAALEVMAALMVTGENERTRLTAAQFILERAYGKAVQQVDGDLDVALQISRIERVILKP